ncbi:ATP-binding cassette domain-containing protein [Microbacterium halotolerans]|uniref:ATP-binding cassette domain-containing protein n=1 Tax=Microbacterium halotolerans TaxID=246613 RepID=UPI000E6AD4CD|nr:ATP-binding cassette domain-containing protein [Microbacterium halotolerans]
MRPPGLRAIGICFAYDDVDVLHEIDAELRACAITAIVGANGTGKSTLMEIMAGTRTPRAGRVERSEEIALVVQRTAIVDTLPLSVRDIVAMGTWGREARGRSRRELRVAVDDALERVGIARLARRSIHEVSGGQRQRALIAQALARFSGPGGILLLDEPSAGLDADSRDGIRAILAEEAAKGRAIGWVTHDHEDVAWADEVIDLTRKCRRGAEAA